MQEEENWNIIQNWHILVPKLHFCSFYYLVPHGLKCTYEIKIHLIVINYSLVHKSWPETFMDVTITPDYCSQIVLKDQYNNSLLFRIKGINYFNQQDLIGFLFDRLDAILNQFSIHSYYPLLEFTPNVHVNIYLSIRILSHTGSFLFKKRPSPFLNNNDPVFAPCFLHLIFWTQANWPMFSKQE